MVLHFGPVIGTCFVIVSAAETIVITYHYTYLCDFMVPGSNIAFIAFLLIAAAKSYIPPS